MRLRGRLAVAGLAAMCVGGPALAQGFGQVTFGTAPADPAAPPSAAPTPTAAPAGHSVDSVTVTGKKVPDSQKDPNEVICKSTIPMGSRFPVKTCASRRDLLARQQGDQAMVRTFEQGIIANK